MPSASRLPPMLVALALVGCGGASGTAQPAMPDEHAPVDSVSARTILPAGRGRPPDLAQEFVGDGACRIDADCTVGRRAPCSFCGGCPQAMTQAEYDELDRQASVLINGTGIGWVVRWVVGSRKVRLSDFPALC